MEQGNVTISRCIHETLSLISGKQNKENHTRPKKVKGSVVRVGNLFPSPFIFVMTCPATCHPEFYFKDGIYHGILVGESNIFVDLFDIGSRGQTVEGTIDECPIWLPELTVKSFDLFVEYKFGR